MSYSNDPIKFQTIDNILTTTYIVSILKSNKQENEYYIDYTRLKEIEILKSIFENKELIKILSVIGEFNLKNPTINIIQENRTEKIIQIDLIFTFSEYYDMMGYTLYKKDCINCIETYFIDEFQEYLTYLKNTDKSSKNKNNPPNNPKTKKRTRGKKEDEYSKGNDEYSKGNNEYSKRGDEL